MKGAKLNILDAIGNTPIVKLNKVATGVQSEIYVKLDFLNPGGSIKDRIGAYILEKAVKNGDLKPGGTVIEGTSGNTGVGLAMYAAVHGYKCVFVLADKQSKEKIDNLRAFGAKVIVCPTNVEPEDPRSYYSVSKRLSETIPNSYYVNQYENLWNRETHFKTTGPEIYNQTEGDFDVFMAGVGTGGTISGIGAYLKTVMPEVKIIGVDCEGSIVAHYAKTGEMCEAKPYVLEGLGEDFIPGNYNFDVIDDWEVIGDKESFLMTRDLLTHEGIYAGGSSGGAVRAAIKYAEKLAEPKKILVLLPDSGNRYASKIFNDDWMSDNGYKDSSFNVTIQEVLTTLKKETTPLISINDTSTIGEAIKVMDENGISQLPVYGSGHLEGIVSERNLLKPVFDGEFKLSDSISLAFKSDFKIIDIGELLSNVADSLLQEETVLVTKNDKVVTVLTNIDILRFISGKN
ncbi:MAG: pyridoxal-phosphate dependent enzyme [Bdellovibrionota bacterium]|nr:pyridoxal-phosphate dependent enzyme [Bdellovibrionota bacterium]|tara:strand:- start:1801 stop:3174 length:1374 start_codon:yes stop_codon:yes gene_type:complete